MLYQQIKKQIEICGICNDEVELSSNLNGLVINDQHFICADCCVNTGKLELTRFVKKKSQGSMNIRPIMRWLWEKSK